jgi:hypothetical protein
LAPRKLRKRERVPWARQPKTSEELRSAIFNCESVLTALSEQDDVPAVAALMERMNADLLWAKAQLAAAERNLA